MREPVRMIADRVIALALVVAVIGLIWLVAVWPITNAILTRQTTLAELDDQLYNYESRRRAASIMPDSNTIERIQSVLYPPAPSGVAVSRLQSHHQELAVESRLRISSVRAQPESTGEALSEVRLQISGSGTIDQLEKYLNAASAHRPMLVVYDLWIRAKERQTAGENPVLELSWSLSALVRNEVENVDP